MQNNYPLISCICITKNRVQSLKKAIGCYIQQDYPLKELVVSYPESDTLTKTTLQKITKAVKIHIIERPDTMTLGAARNNAISKCKGEYMCNWDDDDWYHPMRLSLQFKTMKTSEVRYEACVLNQVILFDKINKKAYLSFLYPWESTLMCKVSVIRNVGYTDRNIGEDSNITDYLDGIKALCHVSEAAYLYIYNYHSDNTWNRKHFESFFQRSRLLSQEPTEAIIEILKLN